MPESFLNALLGGVIIGVAVSLMLYLSGRVTGISGIVKGMIEPGTGDFHWRLSFVLGLILSGFIAREMGISFFNPPEFLDAKYISIAGLIVGVGTAMGSGCTSGHGVCGISRLSPRSIVATLAFMAAGILTVFVKSLF